MQAYEQGIKIVEQMFGRQSQLYDEFICAREQYRNGFFQSNAKMISATYSLRDFDQTEVLDNLWRFEERFTIPANMIIRIMSVLAYGHEREQYDIPMDFYNPGTNCYEKISIDSGIYNDLVMSGNGGFVVHRINNGNQKVLSNLDHSYDPYRQRFVDVLEYMIMEGEVGTMNGDWLPIPETTLTNLRQVRNYVLTSNNGHSLYGVDGSIENSYFIVSALMLEDFQEDAYLAYKLAELAHEAQHAVDWDRYGLHCTSLALLEYRAFLEQAQIISTFNLDANAASLTNKDLMMYSQIIQFGVADQVKYRLHCIDRFMDWYNSLDRQLTANGCDRRFTDMTSNWKRNLLSQNGVY